MRLVAIALQAATRKGSVAVKTVKLADREGGETHDATFWYWRWRTKFRSERLVFDGHYYAMVGLLAVGSGVVEVGNG